MNEGKNTEWINNKLLESDDIADVFEAASEVFIETSFSVRINELLSRKNKTKSEVIKGSALSTPYVYELFNGHKVPTRDRCIMLGFGLGATFEELQEMLRLCELRELYSKVKREAIIIFCIHKLKSLAEADDMLYEMGEDTLC